MNPKLTPELRNALNAQPVGPIRLDDDDSGEPLFLIRLADIPTLQQKVEQQIRQKLAEADADLTAGKVADWDPGDVKQSARARRNIK